MYIALKKFLLIIFAITSVFYGCKKKSKDAGEDLTPPVLTLKGSANDTINLQSTYLDAGATADDNQDGDITSQIISTGKVNTSIAGDYSITYSVNDATGNKSSAVRKVYVRNARSALNGDYEVTCSCQTYTVMTNGPFPTFTFGSIATTNYTSQLSVSDSINNAILISSLFNGAGTYTASALLNDDKSVTGSVPYSSFSGNWGGSPISMSLTATLDHEGQTYKVTKNCTSIFSKK
jgi:hypothetical protein